MDAGERERELARREAALAARETEQTARESELAAREARHLKGANQRKPKKSMFSRGAMLGAGSRAPSNTSDMLFIGSKAGKSYVLASKVHDVAVKDGWEGGGLGSPMPDEMPGSPEYHEDSPLSLAGGAPPDEPRIIELRIGEFEGPMSLGVHFHPTSDDDDLLKLSAVEGVAADRCPLLAPGDKLIAVQGEELVGATHDEALAFLGSCARQRPLVLTFVQENAGSGGSPGGGGGGSPLHLHPVSSASAQRRSGGSRLSTKANDAKKLAYFDSDSDDDEDWRTSAGNMVAGRRSNGESAESSPSLLDSSPAVHQMHVAREWAAASDATVKEGMDGREAIRNGSSTLCQPVRQDTDMYVVRNTRTGLYSLHPGVLEVGGRPQGWLCGALKTSKSKFLLFESAKEAETPPQDMCTKFAKLGFKSNCTKFKLYLHSGEACRASEDERAKLEPLLEGKYANTNMLSSAPRRLTVNVDGKVWTNKEPTWHEEKKQLYLKYTLPHVKPSVKNMILSEDGASEARSVLQVGRFNEHTFTFRVGAPFSALQAFAVALSSIHV